ncbi:MAG: hypothetical protein ACM31P_16710 [Actinomycetota bacterium]
MKHLLSLLAAIAVAAPAFATVVDHRPQTTRVQGRTQFSATHRDATARGSGEYNEARNSAGVIRAGTQIQGNTAITASQEGATAVASGRGNTAANEAGVIGGR